MSWFGTDEVKLPPEDDMMIALGKDLHAALVKQGKAFVRQVVVEATQAGIPPDDLQYVFWVLVANDKSWPDLGDWETKGLKLAVSTMVRTRTAPNYANGFKVPSGVETDELLDGVIRKLGTWGRRVFLAEVLQAYLAALRGQAKAARRLNRNLTSDEHAFEALRRSFPQVLEMKSHWFDDGMLLRKVVQTLAI